MKLSEFFVLKLSAVKWWKGRILEEEDRFAPRPVVGEGETGDPRRPQEPPGDPRRKQPLLRPSEFSGVQLGHGVE